MAIEPLSDHKILDSWKHNALPWTHAVRNSEIESRQLVTDQAVLDATLACKPGNVIDMGCGEGWLALRLLQNGIDVTGVDAVPDLINAAKQAGVADCRVWSYEEIALGHFKHAADVVVCNFSLLGKESVDRLLKAIPALLKPDGTLIVQTLHPLAACGELPYADGWRTGSWAGFNETFTDAPPWYFRTLQTWLELFWVSGLILRAMQEPLDPRTGKPASVIFVAKARA